MTAGLILLGKIWEYTDHQDDAGGYTPSGTVIYEGVQMRLHNPRNTLQMNIQGYETSKFFSVIIQPRPGMNLVEKKHFIQITSPTNHRYYLKKFRIINISEPDVHPSDPRRYLLLNLERSDEPHSEEFQ